MFNIVPCYDCLCIDWSRQLWCCRVLLGLFGLLCKYLFVLPHCLKLSFGFAVMLEEIQLRYLRNKNLFLRGDVANVYSVSLSFFFFYKWQHCFYFFVQ